MYRLKAKRKYHCMPIILEELHAIVKLQQLPLLRLLKLREHDSCCAWAAAAAAAAATAVRHRVPHGAICCCGLMQLIQVYFLCIHTRFVFNASLGSAVSCTASVYLLCYIYNTYV